MKFEIRNLKLEINLALRPLLLLFCIFILKTKSCSMERYEKILRFDNAFEAERMREMLEENDIPFTIIQRTDSALGGISRLEFGWGYLEAPEKYKEEILKFYREIKG